MQLCTSIFVRVSVVVFLFYTLYRALAFIRFHFLLFLSGRFIERKKEREKNSLHGAPCARLISRATYMHACMYVFDFVA